MKKENQNQKEDTRTRYVYLITNTVNFKKYVGQTLSPKSRLQGHISDSRNSKRMAPICCAFRKYGAENFTFEIIYEGFSNLDIDAAEKFFIQHFNSLVDNGVGYNVRLGGNDQPLSSLQGKLKPSGQGKGRRFSGNSSQYLGVRRRGKNQFCCYVNIDAIKSKERNFDSEIECAEAHDKIVLYVYGPNAIINFEEKRQEFLNSDLKSFYENYVNAPPKFPKTSTFNGVRRSYNGKKWMVKFIKKKKIRDSLVLGMFDTQEDAARMADKIMFYYENDSNFNFPDEVKDFDREELGRFFKSIIFKKTSEYKWVYRKGNSWVAKYKENSIVYHIGQFPTQEEAYAAVVKFIKDNNMNPKTPID